MQPKPETYFAYAVGRANYHFFHGLLADTVNAIDAYKAVNPGIDKLTDVEYNILAVRVHLLKEHVDLCKAYTVEAMKKYAKEYTPEDGVDMPDIAE